MAFWKKKKEASSSIGYTFLFLIMLILVLVSFYLLGVAKLMTHQHHVDDSLADSVLASLVADDIYYFETGEMRLTPVIRFKNVDESYRIFKDCMTNAVGQTSGLYYNFAFDQYICYEVEDNRVTITSYNGPGGNKSVSTGTVGCVRSPKGELVTETSAYGRVRFDIKSALDHDNLINKTKDIYCTLEINEN